MVEGMYRNQNSDRINNSPHCAADDNNKAIDTLQYHNKMALLDGVGGGGGGGEVGAGAGEVCGDVVG